MKNINDYDFYEITCHEAVRLGPFGSDDYPVAVTCYRQTKQWKSVKAAKEFYKAGSNCCSGSERERYSNIVAKLENGNRDADDGPLDLF